MSDSDINNDHDHERKNNNKSLIIHRTIRKYSKKCLRCTHYLSTFSKTAFITQHNETIVQ
jgi:hypothetical protein